MKTYTDGAKIVNARHKAEAFDMLQEIYGHPDIAPITEVKKEPDLKWDVNTDLWGEG